MAILPIDDRVSVQTGVLDDPLEQARQTLEALVEATPAAIVCLDCAGNVTLWNRAAERVFGWDAEEVLGKALPAVPENQQELFQELHARVLQGESVSEMEVHGLRKNGSVFPISVSIAPLRNTAGNTRGTMTIILDITSRKQTEAQIRLHAAALESTANAVAITDRTGKIIWVNPAFTIMTGYSAEEVVGQNPRVLNSGKHPKEFFDHLWQMILAGKVWHGETVNRRKDGRLYTEDQTITPVRDEHGEIAYFISIKQDITENKKLTQQLNQAQKMESIGQLAGGVAHDFNNLLSVIIGYCEMILESPGCDDKTRGQLNEVQKAGHRAATLTRQLLAFSRQQVLEPRNLNLNTSVVEIEKMLRRLIGEDIELLISLDVALSSVRADPGQIEQVIMNLAVNARDAMPHGGKLIIETANVDLDGEFAHLHQPMPAGRYVLLAVTDNGTGMSQETKEHVFEPFYTTKEPGKGTGLGLSTVYGVVKQSGGFIWVYSEPGQGSAFKIYLPRVEGAELQTRPTASAPELLRGTETVLLVEDEQSVRALTRDLLEKSGYTVLDADNGAHAVEIARQHHGPIHLLLADVVMPGMNGPAVANMILPIHPEAKTLYVSGYTRSFSNQTGIVPAGANLLQKPFSRASLLQKLRDTLNARKELGTGLP